MMAYHTVERRKAQQRGFVAELLWLLVLAVAMFGLGAAAATGYWQRHPVVQREAAAPFNPVHAQACRMEHAMTTTKRQRGVVTLMCLHDNPERWRASLRARLGELSDINDSGGGGWP